MADLKDFTDHARKIVNEAYLQGYGTGQKERMKPIINMIDSEIKSIKKLLKHPTKLKESRELAKDFLDFLRELRSDAK